MKSPLTWLRESRQAAEAEAEEARQAFDAINESIRYLSDLELRLNDEARAEMERRDARIASLEEDVARLKAQLLGEKP